MGPIEPQVELPTAQQALEALEKGSQPLLNARHERFAMNRADGMSLAESWLKAGFKAKNKGVAASSGAGLLKRNNGRVADRVAWLVQQVTKQAGVTRAKVIEEIAAIGFGNLSDICEWDEFGNLRVKASADLTPQQAALFKKVRLKKGESLEVETHGKLDALDKLARIFKAYPDQQQGPETGVTIVIVAPDKLSNDDWLLKYGTPIEARPG